MELDKSDHDLAANQQPPPAEVAEEEECPSSPSSTCLDLTSYQLHDLDAVDLPTTLIELDLTANRLSRLDSRIAHLSNLKKLSIRQNLFNDAGIEPLFTWHAISNLEVLFFYVIFYPKFFTFNFFKDDRRNVVNLGKFAADVDLFYTVEYMYLNTDASEYVFVSKFCSVLGGPIQVYFVKYKDC